MSYMAQQMDRQIEAAQMNNAELLDEVARLEREKAALAAELAELRAKAVADAKDERIAELEAALGQGLEIVRAENADLRRQLEAKGAEVEALRAGIEKALVEIDDAGPKALKYARQELDAARSAQATAGADGEGCNDV